MTSAVLGDAVLLAGVILVVSLVAPLAAAFGLADGDFSDRAVMVITGAFFTVTGNALPKTLAPLSGHGNPAASQACRRITGWIWVLSGLGVTGAALLLPLDSAEPAAFAQMAIGVFATLVLMVRMRRLRQQGA